MRIADVVTGQVYCSGDRGYAGDVVAIVATKPLYTRVWNSSNRLARFAPATPIEKAGRLKAGLYQTRTGHLAVRLHDDLYCELLGKVRADASYRPDQDSTVIDLVARARLLLPVNGAAPFITDAAGRSHELVVAVPRLLEGELATETLKRDARVAEQRQIAEQFAREHDALMARFTALRGRASSLGVEVRRDGRDVTVGLDGLTRLLDLAEATSFTHPRQEQ